jgi:hypothetical protein
MARVGCVISRRPWFGRAAGRWARRKWGFAPLALAAATGSVAASSGTRGPAAATLQLPRATAQCGTNPVLQQATSQPRPAAARLPIPGAPDSGAFRDKGGAAHLEVCAAHQVGHRGAVVEVEVGDEGGVQGV